MNEDKPIPNLDSDKKKSGRAETQTYMDMSKPHGQDASAAMDDMFVAMMTPGGLLKKTLDSTYENQNDVAQNIANLSNSQNDDNNADTKVS